MPTLPLSVIVNKSPMVDDDILRILLPAVFQISNLLPGFVVPIPTLPEDVTKKFPFTSNCPEGVVVPIPTS